jgi:GrpB-like predicted nucleotidyltransferase (UPF0157 family)
MNGIDPVSDEHMQQVRLEPLIPHNETITLVESDPNSPVLFDREAARVRSALSPAVVQLEHVGSTSVPGLVAKPIIEILLVFEIQPTSPATCRPLLRLATGW